MCFLETTGKERLKHTISALQALVQLLHFVKDFILLLLLREVVLDNHMNATGGSLGSGGFAQRFLGLSQSKNPYLGANEDVRNLVFLTENRDVGDDVHGVNVRRQNENTSGQVE